MNYSKELKELTEEINRVFVGKEQVVRLLITSLLAGGHILLEDVPGVGKTTLAKALSGAVGARLGRIQFTPDTLAGDVTGVSVYNAKTCDFEYKQGVIMNQILLADEINRTAPKTQASLLEAMAERQVTVDGKSYELPRPFMVIATQNPIEFAGTYPLPEAQMDRFLMRITIGYPSRENEIKMTRQALNGITAEKIRQVCDTATIEEMQKEAGKIKVHEDILKYIADIISLTRSEERFVMGASPRAMIALTQAAQANAYQEERDFCIPDDVKNMAIAVLGHRLVLSPEARMKKEDAAGILKSLILQAPVPLMK